MSKENVEFNQESLQKWANNLTKYSNQMSGSICDLDLSLLELLKHLKSVGSNVGIILSAVDFESFTKSGELATVDNDLANKLKQNLKDIGQAFVFLREKYRNVMDKYKDLAHSINYPKESINNV
jgi:hypothetical protein